MRFLPHTRLGVLWRAGLALVLVVGFAAGATATAGLLTVNKVVQAVDQTPALSDVPVTLPKPGQPQTFLLIGVDHRYGEPGGAGSTDTMLLVRIDDNSKTINMLSIPRDLEVQLPGAGGVMEDSKLNAAYAAGGARLLLDTIRSQVFPGFHVNNIVITTFAGFADLVNQLGCVYGDVDHRYYNNSAVTDYSSIDLQPGYQRLCGGGGADLGGPDTALAFVRFRHTDSDEVRNARQQDFLRWARDQYSVSYLVSHEQALLNTFFRNTQVTHELHTTDGILNLVNLVLNADGLELKTISFPEVFGPCNPPAPCYVFASSKAAEAQAYRELLTPSTTIPPVGHVRLGNGRAPGHGRHHVKRGQAGFQAPAGMLADPTDGRSQADQLGGAGLPVYYPKLVPDNYQYCFTITSNCIDNGNPSSAYTNSYPRSYTITGYRNRHYPAYVFTLCLGAKGGPTSTGEGLYFTVQGTTWQDPPLLTRYTLIRTVNGKRLYIYSQGGKISTVAWHTRRAVYWIQNNLENAIPNDQMVAMAATLTPVRG